MPSPYRSKGFTLVELLITIVIFALLVTIAIPSFADIIRNNRVTAQSNELLALLWVARSEAVKRKEDVTVAITQPVSGGWTGVVCPQDDLTGAICDTTALIRRSEYEGSPVVISDSAGNDQPFLLRFDDLGRLQYNHIGATYLVLQHQSCLAPKSHRRELLFTANGSVSIRTEVCS